MLSKVESTLVGAFQHHRRRVARFRNSRVMRAKITWLPTSWSAVWQQATRSMNGIRNFSPGVNTRSNLPSRSTTQAFCCGTIVEVCSAGPEDGSNRQLCGSEFGRAGVSSGSAA